MKTRRLTLCLAFLIIALTAHAPAVFADLYAFAPDDDKVLQSFESEYNWDTDLIDAGEWTGEDGELYERIISQQREYYNDLAHWSEEFCLEHEIISKEEYSKAGNAAGRKLAEVALAELEAPDNSESPPHSQNVKYNTWFYGHEVSDSSENSYAWCAAFVSWCANECGLIDDGTFPKDALVKTHYSFFVDEQGCEPHYVGDDYDPKPGDIWYASDLNHIGIVVGSNGGFPDVVHGNTSIGGNDGVNRSTMSDGIVVHPPYPAAFLGGDAASAREIYDYLLDNGYNEAQAAGIVANLHVETGGTFSPGAYNPDDGGSESVGICQWHLSRIDTLQSWCELNELDWTTVEGQLAYMIEEASPGSPYYAWSNSYGGYESFISVSNDAYGAGEAAYYWGADWERCADPDARRSLGEQYYYELAN